MVWQSECQKSHQDHNRTVPPIYLPNSNLLDLMNSDFEGRVTLAKVNGKQLEIGRLVDSSCDI